MSGAGVLLDVSALLEGVEGDSLAALEEAAVELSPVEAALEPSLGGVAVEDRRLAGFVALVLAVLFEVLFALGAAGSGAGVG